MQFSTYIVSSDKFFCFIKKAQIETYNLVQYIIECNMFFFFLFLGDTSKNVVKRKSIQPLQPQRLGV